MTVKRAILEALRAQLATALGNGVRVRAVQQEAQADDVLPSVTVLPQDRAAALFTPSPAPVAVEFVGGKWLMQYGVFSLPVEIRAAHKTAIEREVLEEAILAEFFADRAGTLMLQVSGAKVGTIEVSAVPCAFSVRSAVWNEELVFNRRRYSFITLDAAFGLYVAKDYATASEIHLMVSHHLNDEIAANEAKDYLVSDDGPVLQP